MTAAEICILISVITNAVLSHTNGVYVLSEYAKRCQCFIQMFLINPGVSRVVCMNLGIITLKPFTCRRVSMFINSPLSIFCVPEQIALSSALSV